MILQEQSNWIKNKIEEHQTIYLFHHVSPDGDCMAASFGLAKAIRNTYPNKDVKVVADKEDYTPRFDYMEKHLDWSKTVTKPEVDNYLIIVGDTSVGYRTRFLENFNEENDLFCYDHHENNLELKADQFWKEAKYPAAAMMAYEIAESINLTQDKTSALLMFHGIITDTGSFRYSGANPRPLEIAAKLTTYIDNTELEDIYYGMSLKTKEQMEFTGWVLANYTTDEDVAYHIVTLEDQKRFNMKSDQSAQVWQLNNIDGIKASLFFIQYEDYIRVEFRSRTLKVNEIATSFGGGGHESAAGCKIFTFDDVEKIITEVKKHN